MKLSTACYWQVMDRNIPCYLLLLSWLDNVKTNGSEWPKCSILLATNKNIFLSYSVLKVGGFLYTESWLDHYNSSMQSSLVKCVLGHIFSIIFQDSYLRDNWFLQKTQGKKSLSSLSFIVFPTIQEKALKH